MLIRTRAPQGQFLLSRILGGAEGLTVEVRGFALDTLAALANRVEQSMATVAGVTDIEVSREARTPQQEIRVDRDKIADLGLSIRDVTQAMETAVAGFQAGEFRTHGNSYRILVQLQDVEKRSLDEILDLTLSAASGELVVSLVLAVEIMTVVGHYRRERRIAATIPASYALSSGQAVSPTCSRNFSCAFCQYVTALVRAFSPAVVRRTSLPRLPFDAMSIRPSRSRGRSVRDSVDGDMISSRAM